MRVFRHSSDLPSASQGGIIAIGNFDGVHRGHQAVIGEAVQRARAAGLPASVLTFEPHPRRFFRPETPPFLLTRFRTKARVLTGLGVDNLFVLRFNAALAAFTAEDFIDRILVGGLHASQIVVGYDFVFGKGRHGNPDLLRHRLTTHRVDTLVMPPVAAPHAEPDGDSEGLIYSSTGVRDALRAGDPRAAARLLGRPFEIEGRVRRGDARGRLLGFPTANIWLGDYMRPALGVYAIRAKVDEPASPANLTGVANLGLRPTFGGTEPRLEVHLFDFQGDLYGRRLAVELIEFLRPERKFEGIDALKAQIAADATAAKAVLAKPARAPQGDPTV